MYSVAVHQSLDDLMHGARLMMQWIHVARMAVLKKVRYARRER